MATNANKKVTQSQVRSLILGKAKALGNSHYGLKEVVSDLLNAHGGDLDEVAKGTFLCKSTLEHLKTLEDTPLGTPYRPQADTLERVLRYFGTEIHFKQVTIRHAYRNKPKIDPLESE